MWHDFNSEKYNFLHHAGNLVLSLNFDRFHTLNIVLVLSTAILNLPRQEW